MIEKLEWDSRFFGRKIGRLTEAPPKNVLRRLIRKAQKDNYSYLTCRFNLNKISEIQSLENHGFYLTDIGIVWERNTDNKIEPLVLAREATTKDAAVLKKIARGLFKDSRFYNDPFFTYEEAENFYQTWIENSLKDKNIKTFLIKKSGFVTCKKLRGNRGNIPLIGVISARQDKGIGSSLVYKALNWFKKIGVKTVSVRTQANNIKAMNFYMGEGFKIKYTDVTMGLVIYF